MRSIGEQHEMMQRERESEAGTAYKIRLGSGTSTTNDNQSDYESRVLGNQDYDSSVR